jgi:hypothetical protein
MWFSANRMQKFKMCSLLTKGFTWERGANCIPRKASTPAMRGREEDKDLNTYKTKTCKESRLPSHENTSTQEIVCRYPNTRTLARKINVGEDIGCLVHDIFIEREREGVPLSSKLQLHPAFTCSRSCYHSHLQRIPDISWHEIKLLDFLQLLSNLQKLLAGA